MNITFKVYRLQYTPDQRGGRSRALNYSHDLPGRVRTANSDEKLRAKQLGTDISHVVYCMADQDIKRGDLLKWDNETRDVKIHAVKPAYDRNGLHHYECPGFSRQYEGEG